MAPTYKLTYFPSKALAESIRMMFSYADIEFEDFRFERENWLNIKPNMPFEQVPILEHNGKTAHQSVALGRYVAKLAKLVGNNEWEDLEIDMIVDTINDFRGKIAAWFYQPDEEIKEKFKGPLFNEIIPFYIKKFEAIAKENNGHFALGRLTWADFYWTGMLDYLKGITELDFTTESPNLKAVETNVTSLPKIKAWIAKRPVTQL